ncbi:MAG TPA: DNA-directed RNA polymerase subunit omega [Vicinamibacterales bacterium]|nr:DNA-directed RNA polymerase subunit omega [Vicinamibacterales bacterium]
MKISDRSEVRNAFEFVTVSSARARQLLAGCTPRTAGSEKPAKLAQREVREGKIRKVEEAE